jgi:hypothetical protein
MHISVRERQEPPGSPALRACEGDPAGTLREQRQGRSTVTRPWLRYSRT